MQQAQLGCKEEGKVPSLSSQSAV